MIRRSLILLVLLVLMVASAACGSSREFAVQGTEKSIGVDGTIEIMRQVEDVNVVYVDLINLPPPERHDLKRKAFVVWLTAEDGPTIKAGRLSYDADARRGRLEVTTPNNQVYVQITLEKTSKVLKPSDFVVIGKHVTLNNPDA